MRTHATAQKQTASTLVLPARGGVLQRKCACGGTPGPTGECVACRRKRQPGGMLQTKLRVNQPGDRYEQEADRVAEQVMRMPAPVLQRQVDDEEEELLQAKPLVQRRVIGGAGGNEAPPIVHEVLRSPGRPLDPSTRRFMEARFGHDFSRVRVHADGKAAESTQALNARAYTVGRNVVFRQGEYAPASSEEQHLLAHELVHVMQQGGAPQTQWTGGNHGGKRSDLHDGIAISGHKSAPAIQRQANAPGAQREQENVTGPLTDREWQLVELWLNNGEVGTDPLTEDARHNAEIVAAAIFCGRMLSRLVSDDSGEDPLLCVIPDVTRADPRVQQLVHEVEARGPIINWARVDPDQRMLYVMRLLVNTYGYPVNGAAGLVGNLFAESGVLPNRIEGSARETPMRARDFRGRITDFTAEQVMNRNRQLRQGPRRPDVGLAQWTSPARRAGLFQHQFGGRQVSAAILFNMDAQVDYLVTELQARFPRVDGVLRRAGVSVDDASDEVVLNFETPAAVIAGGRRLPRTDPRVQVVFRRRRAHAQRALRVFNQANQGN